jgi:hypothetical protein
VFPIKFYVGVGWHMLMRYTGDLQRPVIG